MDVFIGYTQDAAPFARRLRDDLRAAGFSVWSAEEDVKPGENWAQELSRVVRDAKNIIIVLTRVGATTYFARCFSAFLDRMLTSLSPTNCLRY